MPWNIFDICENIRSSTVHFTLEHNSTTTKSEEMIHWRQNSVEVYASLGGKGHFPCGTSNKEPAHQWGRFGFDL